MLSDETTRYFIVIEAVVVVFTLVFGFYTYVTEEASRVAKEDLGLVCCQKRLMGYFVAKKPNTLAYFLRRTTTKIPDLPSIESLIQAGDCLMYSSSLFDQIPAIPQDVCWVSLYTQFFNEMAWRNARISGTRNKTKSTEWHLSQAYEYVHKKRKESEEFFRNTNPPKPKGDLENQSPLSPSIPQSDKTLDRHCMYLYHLRATKTRSLQLISCIWPFDGIPNCLDLRETRPLLLMDRKPCIEMSREEFAGLCLALGIHLLIQKDGSMSGTGPFGTYLSLSRNLNHWRVHLTHQHRQSDHERQFGSGYSTLFAKYMACNSLPFDLCNGRVRFIYINDTLLELIRGFNVGPLSKYPLETPDLKYLSRMPTAYYSDLYCSIPEDPQDRSSESCRIRDHSLESYQTQWVQPLSETSSGENSETQIEWFQAVARIAFGGLVPQAGRELADAVLFTVTGKEREIEWTGPSTSRIIALQRLIDALHRDSPDLKLFGEYVAERAGQKRTKIETDCYIQSTTRHAGALFNRYMTAIERLTAMILFEGNEGESSMLPSQEYVKKMAKPPGEQGVWIEWPEEDNTGPKLRVRKVCEACSKLLSLNFHNKHNDELHNSVDEVTQKVARKEPIDVDDCAKVAMCIIASWAFRVPYIKLKWDAREANEAWGEHLTPAFNDLPAVMAFGV